MEFKKVNLVYFSATDVSKKYAQAMGNALEKEVVEFDFTVPENRDPAKAPAFGKDDLVILALPIYGGRVPTVCLEYVEALKGDETPCVVIGTYGNRHYDDAVVEMEDLMNERGFVVAAGGAVVGRHSFSDNIAGNRPDAADLEGAAEFIKKRGRMTRKLESPIELCATNGVRYTVPQIITGKNDVSVFFRVADVYKNATIVVKDGDEIVYKKKKLHLAPGEMERVELNKDIIKNIKTGSLSFSLNFNS